MTTMKNTLRLFPLLLLVALTIAGCQDNPVSALGDTVAEAPTAHAATAMTSSVREPFEGEFFSPCGNGGAGELITFSGTIHIVSRTTVDVQGGAHITLRSNVQGAEGVGQTTGDVYRGTGMSSSVTNTNPGGLPYTGTFVNNFRLIGQGPGTSLHVHEVVHFTINENGELTAEVTNVSTECR